MRVVIAGGGVAGTACAVALAATGAEVTLYEAYEDPAGPVGSFLSLAANGLRGLDVLGALDAVRAAGFAVPRQRMWAGNGKLLGDVARARTAQDPMISVTLMRSDLVSVLREQARRAGARIVTGRAADQRRPGRGGRGRHGPGGRGGRDLVGDAAVPRSSRARPGLRRPVQRVRGVARAGARTRVVEHDLRAAGSVHLPAGAGRLGVVVGPGVCAPAPRPGRGPPGPAGCAVRGRGAGRDHPAGRGHRARGHAPPRAGAGSPMARRPDGAGRGRGAPRRLRAGRLDGHRGRDRAGPGAAGQGVGGGRAGRLRRAAAAPGGQDGQDRGVQPGRQGGRAGGRPDAQPDDAAVLRPLLREGHGLAVRVRPRHPDRDGSGAGVAT